MLSPKVKNDIASLWNTVSAAALASSPYVALEQIACLIFLKSLHNQGQARHSTSGVQVGEGAILWGKLLKAESFGDCLQQDVFPWLRALASDDVFSATLNGVMDDVYFQLDCCR